MAQVSPFLEVNKKIINRQNGCSTKIKSYSHFGVQTSKVRLLLNISLLIASDPDGLLSFILLHEDYLLYNFQIRITSIG